MLLATMGGAAVPAAAQTPRAWTRFEQLEPPSAPDAAPSERAQEPYVSEAGRAFLFSALLPGAGQWRLGLDRWVPYAAVEVWGWMTFFQRREQGKVLERRYRDLAWSVARRVSIGVRQEAEWDYYESLGKYHASGVYDADPRTEGVQPELDPTTYNGVMWELAQAIHIPGGVADPTTDPQSYARALEYYQRRAVRPEFAWSWGDNGLEREVYRELIHDRDETLRSATRALGVILANHLVAAVDALVTARLRSAGGAGPDWNVRGSLEPDPGAGGWRAAVRLTWPGSR